MGRSRSIAAPSSGTDEVSGIDRVQRIEFVYKLDSGETPAEVAALFAHLFSKKFGQPTLIDDKQPGKILYNWVKGQRAGDYYFRILVLERDERTGERIARMWIKAEL